MSGIRVEGLAISLVSLSAAALKAQEMERSSCADLTAREGGGIMADLISGHRHSQSENHITEQILYVRMANWNIALSEILVVCSL